MTHFAELQKNESSNSDSDIRLDDVCEIVIDSIFAEFSKCLKKHRTFYIETQTLALKQLSA